MTTTIVGVIFVYNFQHQAPSVPIPSPNDFIALSQPEQLNYGLPMRLSIPVINIDAAFENVGITPDGAMDMPKNVSNIGWYDLGKRPGDIGSAVIAGHSGLKTKDVEAFNNIDKLAKGDKIYVTDDMGNIISFIVRESKNFDSLADTTSVFISNDDQSHLNLITCDGVWDNTAKSYSDRLVIFADKE